MRFKLVVGAAMSVAMLLAAAPAAHAVRPVREPVILVHGWIGHESGMAVMRDAFAAAGYPAYTIELPGQNNVVNAQKIAALVATVRARTGAAKVHLVSHSMGGLSTRYFIKRLGGARVVRTYVSLGTPQYGYWAACLLIEAHGGQMCSTSAFLADLNAGDDTPGDVAYSSFRGAMEDPQLTKLDGGACLAQPAKVDHNAEPTAPAFIAAALAAVGGRCPGTVEHLAIS